MSIIAMESELVARVNELIELCKRAVAEQRISDESVGCVNAIHSKPGKSKSPLDQRKKLKQKLQLALKDAENVQEALLAAQSKILEIKAIEHQIKVAKGPRSFRRGVLMSLLQDNAKSLPLWAGRVGASPPPFCGAVGTSKPEDYVVAGDHVAALVPDPEARGPDSATLESWILAEIVAYSAEKKEFRVDDVDAEEGKVRYVLEKAKVIPLPKWKADPVVNPEAIFPKGTVVLALYPQTTCFYRALVDNSPSHVHDEYSLYFEDPSYPNGYAPAIRIPQRYVIFCPSGDPKNTEGNERKPPPGGQKKR
uniref:SGF29 C-terminal domain-containing protein n=2 Tax=Schistocephalus solidus TaxID=70667 RepID=A0A0X3PTJ9_SCHSO